MLAGISETCADSGSETGFGSRRWILDWRGFRNEIGFWNVEDV